MSKKLKEPKGFNSEFMSKKDYSKFLKEIDELIEKDVPPSEEYLKFLKNGEKPLEKNNKHYVEETIKYSAYGLRAMTEQLPPKVRAGAIEFLVAEPLVLYQILGIDIRTDKTPVVLHPSFRDALEMGLSTNKIFPNTASDDMTNEKTGAIKKLAKKMAKRNVINGEALSSDPEDYERRIRNEEERLKGSLRKSYEKHLPLIREMAADGKHDGTELQDLLEMLNYLHMDHGEQEEVLTELREKTEIARENRLHRNKYRFKLGLYNKLVGILRGYIIK